ncbi:MAG TPA: hypothetical protein PKC97_05785 [Burkholderiaceae bacterium]|nr:hypothetical protein [Burkholderiaceae bacterium]
MAGFAAIEARWKNEQPASEVLIVWHDAAERRNRFASSVPGRGRVIASGAWAV